MYVPQYGDGTASLNVTVATSIVLQHFAQWAGYQEHGREGQKFVVGERPQRTTARGARKLATHARHICCARSFYAVRKLEVCVRKSASWIHTQALFQDPPSRKLQSGNDGSSSVWTARFVTHNWVSHACRPASLLRGKLHAKLNDMGRYSVQAAAVMTVAMVMARSASSRTVSSRETETSAISWSGHALRTI